MNTVHAIKDILGGRIEIRIYYSPENQSTKVFRMPLVTGVTR
jgi:hypothetical protein